MVAGDPTPAMVHFGGYDAYGVEPINLVGQMNAPANACGGLHALRRGTSDYLFWDICLDWTTPGNTTISADPTRIAGTPFVPYFDEVPQQGSANGLDPFGTHIMYRANARAFPADAPTRISLVVNHVVQGDVQQGGINWIHFNLDDHGQTFTTPTPLDKTLLEEGVYAPDSEQPLDGRHRDRRATATSASASRSRAATIHPQIQISGRTAEDPPGTLEDEQNCTDGIGNGSQTSSSDRWGDYSAMSVDPVDQCTFYFTNEYYPTTAGASWHTRVCSFKFDSCGQPDYALVAETPPRIELCGATTSTDPSYSLRAGVLNGFTGAVNLVANGVPAGATADFSVNPINAPGSSVLTLTGGAALPSGEYAMTVDGTSGSTTRSVALSLGVSATAPAAVTLLTPLDAAAGVKVRPLLVWGSAAGDDIFADGFDGGTRSGTRNPARSPDALSYTVDVATDSAFTNIVTSATVETTSWAVDVMLDATTTYFWRVTPHNYCGDGAVSATFSFTTGVPGECPAGTTSTTRLSGRLRERCQRLDRGRYGRDRLDAGYAAGRHRHDHDGVAGPGQHHDQRSHARYAGDRAVAHGGVGDPLVRCVPQLRTERTGRMLGSFLDGNQYGRHHVQLPRRHALLHRPVQRCRLERHAGRQPRRLVLSGSGGLGRADALDRRSGQLHRPEHPAPLSHDHRLEHGGIRSRTG